VQSGSCSALSEVIALVLERFFLRADDVAEPASAPPEPTPPAPAAAAPPVAASPAVSAASLTQAEPIAVPVERTPPASVSTEPHTWASAELWANTAWLAPSLGLARDFGDSYRLGLGGGFDLVQHRAAVFEGSATLQRVPLWLSGSAFWRLGSAVRARSSLELLAVLELAETRALAESGSGARVVPGLGARLGADFFPQSRAQPFIELTAAWLAGSLAPAFQVGDREVLESSNAALGLSVGIQTPF
jgi:hypothetical protein